MDFLQARFREDDSTLPYAAISKIFGISEESRVLCMRRLISGRIVLYARYCLEGGSVRLLEREKQDTVMRTF